jgi:hypothetical protein
MREKKLSNKKWKEWAEGGSPNDATPESDYMTPIDRTQTDFFTPQIQEGTVALVIKQEHEGNLAIQIQSNLPFRKRLWCLLTNWWTYLIKGMRRW